MYVGKVLLCEWWCFVVVVEESNVVDRGERKETWQVYIDFLKNYPMMEDGKALPLRKYLKGGPMVQRADRTSNNRLSPKVDLGYFRDRRVN